MFLFGFFWFFLTLVLVKKITFYTLVLNANSLIDIYIVIYMSTDSYTPFYKYSVELANENLAKLWAPHYTAADWLFLDSPRTQAVADI